MEFFKPAWKSKNKAKAMKAVTKITDQATLERVASSALFDEVRFAAILGIDGGMKQEKLFSAYIYDQVLIKFVVQNKNPDYWGIRISAIKKLNEKLLLVKIAQNDKSPVARRAAVEKLTDQAVLFEIAITDSDNGVRLNAVNVITDQQLLAYIAGSEKNDDILLAIALKVIDENLAQEIFARIAKGGGFKDRREVALKQLTNQNLLADVALSGIDGLIRQSAVDKITDQSILAKIATNANDRGVRGKAVGKLTDCTLLADFAKQDNDQFVSIMAVENITDKTVLAYLANNAEDSRVRQKAAEKVTDNSFVSASYASERNKNNLCPKCGANLKQQHFEGHYAEIEMLVTCTKCNYKKSTKYVKPRGDD